MSITETRSELSQLDERQNPSIAVELNQKNIQDSSEFGEAPDGGLRAWLVAIGGSAICFCCLGFANAFGTFEEYYLQHQLQNESPDNIAWIGSIAAFLQFAAGLVGGPLFDRFGAWVSLSFSKNREIKANSNDTDNPAGFNTLRLPHDDAQLVR